MGNKLLITTVSTPGDYEFFIPIFTVAAKFAYPDCDVKVFMMGGKNDDFGKKYRNRISTPNALRFLLPDGLISQYEYVYITDVDLLVMECDPSHVDYFGSVMQRAHQPIAAARGPLSRPKRPNITTSWTGKYTRLAGGSVMIKTKVWLKRTANARKKREVLLESGNPDFPDTVGCASYREYDEVMLGRICSESGYLLPKKKNCFVDSSLISAEYRGIHLGDFKFAKRWRNKNKMSRILPDKTIKKYLSLRETNAWEKAVEVAMEHSFSAKMVRNLEKHVSKRTK